MGGFNILRSYNNQSVMHPERPSADTKTKGDSDLRTNCKHKHFYKRKEEQDSQRKQKHNSNCLNLISFKQ